MRIPKVPLYLNYMYIVDRTQRIPTSVQRSLFSYAVMLGQTLNKTAIHIRKKRDEADKHGSPFLNVCTYYTAFYHENQLQLKKAGGKYRIWKETLQSLIHVIIMSIEVFMLYALVVLALFENLKYIVLLHNRDLIDL